MKNTFGINYLNKPEKLYLQNTDLIYALGEEYANIGGKSKTIKQIAGVENAYLVKDNIEFASKKEIPLWMFGLLY